MKRIILLLFVFFSYKIGICQSASKVSMSLYLMGNKTILDRTFLNNSNGVGLNLLTGLTSSSRFSPILGLGANYFFGDKKAYYYIGRTYLEPKKFVYNLLAGVSYRPSNKLSTSISAGPCILNSNTFLGLEPSISYYLTKDKRWTIKASWITILQKGDNSNEPFSYLSMGVGAKMF